ncbi:MAG: hypothetical protein ACKOCX_12065 [Planctomycetota bacterium]
MRFATPLPRQALGMMDGDLVQTDKLGSAAISPDPGQGNAHKPGFQLRRIHAIVLALLGLNTERQRSFPGAWLLALAVGCDAGVRQPGSRPTSASFAEQIRAIRDGKSDRIEAVAPLGRDEWQSLRGLAGLRECLLREGVAGDAEAEILATLPDVERLVLRRSPLSDAGFSALARCRSLRDLNVPHAACTAAGIEALTALPELERLRLGGPSLSGPDAARAIATLPALESLHLIDVAIGDEGLAALAELATLRNLYLDGAGVSDAAWERYFEARPGVHVHVDQAHHDRDPGRDHE